MVVHVQMQSSMWQPSTHIMLVVTQQSRRKPIVCFVAACCSIGAADTTASDYSQFQASQLESGNTAGGSMKWFDFRIPAVKTIVYKVRPKAAVMSLSAVFLWPCVLGPC